MNFNAFPTTIRMLFVSVIALNSSIGFAYGQSAQSPTADPTDAGKTVFKRANCMGCHKWHGNGGGGYGGDALSLRKTELTRDQIIETVSCGRPGTGMPFFVRGAYDEVKCHGMTRQEAGALMPPEGGTFLRPKDIEAVADYVLAHIKGAGDPSYAECVAFFSNSSRVCDIYKTQSKADDAAADTGKSQ
jgi:mono/diheme cytochrome c family protein